jgi:bifunctional non-homologous end joining protein LigD
MGDRLGPYRAKRDFDATPEPAPAEAAGDGAQRYVVQEHHARALHWDLRLEHEGTLASWAVPKGIPPDPKRNNLAVRTEDHPLEYLDFHGEIPAGEYGAGTMKIWDRGTYELHKWRKDEVMVTFHGERLEGRYVLFRTDGKNWMIHRMDPPQDADREPMPSRIEPMLARTGPLPPDDGRWGYEVKWDGIRAIGYADGGRLKLLSRNNNDVTGRYPELRELGRALGSRQAVLDGEIVAFGPDGKPSFQVLQSRMHVVSDAAQRRLAAQHPVAYVIFDVLFLDGHSLMDLPYERRREALAALELSGPNWQTPAHRVGDGAALLEATRAQGLEGVIAKRLDCPYVPGRRSQGWVKVKNIRRTDVVIGGWLGGEGGRRGRLGALVVGYHDEDGALRYAGRVGSGFDDRELDRLGRILGERGRDTSPFEGRQPPKLTHFVEPDLVAAVDYSMWTSSNTLRAPSYKGLRDDVPPQEVRGPDDDS